MNRVDWAGVKHVFYGPSLECRARYGKVERLDVVCEGLVGCW